MQTLHLESWEQTRVKKLYKRLRLVQKLVVALKIVCSPVLLVIRGVEMFGETTRREIFELKAEVCVDSYLRKFEKEYEY